MKNINYDLTKMLQHKLDNVGLMEKYYIKDATKVKCHSVAAWNKILADEKRHVAMLRDEIAMRVKAKIFD